MSSVTLNTIQQFAHSQAAPSKEAAKENDCFDRISKYATTTDGAWDVFRALENFFGYFPYLPFSASTQESVQQMRSGADLFGCALSIPSLFKNINDVRHSFADWRSEANDPSSEKSTEAFFKVVRESVKTVNTTGQAALCLNSANIIPLNGALSAVHGVFQASTIIADGWDLKDQIERVQNPESDLDKQYGMLMIAKDIASVVGAAILLVSIFFAALAEGLVFVLLGLSTVYVVSSILAYITQEKIEDQKNPIGLKV